MNPVQPDPVVLAYYSRRRLTRDQLGACLNANVAPNAHEDMLQDLTIQQRTLLLDTGKGVCRIEISEDQPLGTGFYLGGGWVMTNRHVIQVDNDNRTLASTVSFVFPEGRVGPDERDMIIAHTIDPPGTSILEERVKDIALIYVRELEDPNIKLLPTALYKLPDKDPVAGKSVYLIHYGNGIDSLPIPQQFSVKDSALFLLFTNPCDNCMFVHTAHSRPGASGAPLLAFNDEKNDIIVIGINFARAPQHMFIDSPAFALQFHGGHWIRKAWPVSSRLRSKLLDINVPQLEQALTADSRGSILKMQQDNYKLLQDLLRDHDLRAILARSPPQGIDATEYPNIVFLP